MLAVIRRGDDAYGMNVRRELETVTGRDMTIGSVYATLDRLEAKGLVSSLRTAGADAESRRVFAVTGAGRTITGADAVDARTAMDRRQAPVAAQYITAPSALCTGRCYVS